MKIADVTIYFKNGMIITKEIVIEKSSDLKKGVENYKNTFLLIKTAIKDELSCVVNFSGLLFNTINIVAVDSRLANEFLFYDLD